MWSDKEADGTSYRQYETVQDTVLKAVQRLNEEKGEGLDSFTLAHTGTNYLLLHSPEHRGLSNNSEVVLSAS